MALKLPSIFHIYPIIIIILFDPLLQQIPNCSASILKLHGANGSPATFRALAALYEKDLHFDFVTVNLATQEHKSPQFLTRNPFGQVPVFEDGDFKLFESRAITKYVSTAYADVGTDLIFKDPKKSAIQTVWMEVEAQKFEPTTSKLTWELFFKSMFGLTTDEAVVTAFEKKLADLLDVYEQRLTASKYLGGDRFSLADLHHLPNTYILMGTKVKSLFDVRPRVSAWAEDILSRPAWTKVVSLCSS
ncbi:glutathione S-transferase-like [Bidens hawaiensis]|uniref:glutathione S-transferase-like n=1 Tax=Bidens hawaiensis TaxID=980011 RepID=UPI00404AF241